MNTRDREMSSAVIVGRKALCYTVTCTVRITTFQKALRSPQQTLLVLVMATTYSKIERGIALSSAKLPSMI